MLASETMPLVAERFDLVVLGGGSAARDGANMAMRDYDARVALVERVRWGGSCPNVACSPTKAYLVAAELAHDLNSRAPVIGIETGPARVDLARVRAWKESLKKTQEQWVRDLEGAGLGDLQRAGHVHRAAHAARRRARAGGRPDPGRNRLAHRSAAGRGDRRDRLARPRLGARPDRGAAVAAGRRLRRGRPRVRADVLALRRAGADRRRVRADRPARRRRGVGHARSRAPRRGDRAGGERLRPARAPGRRRGGRRRSRRATARSPTSGARSGCCWRRAACRTSRSWASRPPVSRRPGAGSRWTSTCAPRRRASGRPAT